MKKTVAIYVPFALVPLGVCSQSISTLSKHPNVIVILADDMGWGDLACHGNPIIETPNIDELTKASFCFSNFYVHPVSAPTRASLLTGRHYLRTGVRHVHGGGDFLHQDEVTMAEWFKANGYATGLWGKWHSGKTTGYFPWERGFDEAYMAQLYIHHNNRGLLNGDAYATEGWTTDVITEMALNFMEKNREQPFFAFISHLAPHAPLKARPDIVEKYREKGLGETMATVFAMVEMIDTSVGRILNRLEELNIRENTLILFMSDNGPQYFGDLCSEYDYRMRNPGNLLGFKGSMWENGIKVPCILNVPCEKGAGREVEELVSVEDILPTFIDLCNLEREPDNALEMDGQSISDLLRGDKREGYSKEFVIFSNEGWPPVKGAKHPWPNWEKEEYAPTNEFLFDDQLIGLRCNRWKYIQNPGYADNMSESDDRSFLFSCIDSVDERRNCASENSLLRDSCRHYLKNWLCEILNEEHLYAAPRFAIGDDATNVVWLYAPSMRIGNVVNYALESKGWNSQGDGSEYLINVLEPGEYRLKLKAKEKKCNISLMLYVDEVKAAVIDFDSDEWTSESISLPKGFHKLKFLVSPKTEAEQSSLTALYFKKM